jgi:hypothetical protein
MPIRSYVGDCVFTPQALSAMSTALEAALEILGLDGDEAKRGAVARFIIRLAREDDSLDAAELRDKAVAALGGVAYLPIAQVPQPSNSTQAQNELGLGATSSSR